MVTDLLEGIILAVFQFGQSYVSLSVFLSFLSIHRSAIVWLSPMEWVLWTINRSARLWRICSVGQLFSAATADLPIAWEN
mmetsp:Transcript_43601/g.81149  ORF Transcript_43601/g.81149 Transcript_43601/m.81149 type:complete len:80 (-) Transcript_43601:619-858(-)